MCTELQKPQGGFSQNSKLGVSRPLVDTIYLFSNQTVTYALMNFPVATGPATMSSIWNFLHFQEFFKLMGEKCFTNVAGYLL